jgi:hypothetical protein
MAAGKEKLYVAAAQQFLHFSQLLPWQNVRIGGRANSVKKQSP